MRTSVSVPCSVLALLVLAAPAAAQRGGAEANGLEERLRREGDAVLALADAAAGPAPVPADFSLEWHNDFLKAQSGTFIPFVVSISAAAGESGPVAALLYVRAAQRRRDRPLEPVPSGAEPAPPPRLPEYAFEDIYPVVLPPSGGPLELARGFWAMPGEYEVTVVVRERERDGGRHAPKAGVLSRRLTVPAFGEGLTTSTIMIADRLMELPAGPPAEALAERPYVIGNREIHPLIRAEFPRNAELIVVFLIYNPAVTFDRRFDLEVEYHFFRKTAAGEVYVNRTEPQRFTPAVLGPPFDPSAGQPVLAGQGVPLSGFEPGEYRLRITVADRVSGQAVEREASFTVRS